MAVGIGLTCLSGCSSRSVDCISSPGTSESLELNLGIANRQVEFEAGDDKTYIAKVVPANDAEGNAMPNKLLVHVEGQVQASAATDEELDNAGKNGVGFYHRSRDNKTDPPYYQLYATSDPSTTVAKITLVCDTNQTKPQ